MKTLITTLILLLLIACGSPPVNEGVYVTEIEYTEDNQIFSLVGWTDTYILEIRHQDQWTLTIHNTNIKFKGKIDPVDQDVLVFKRITPTQTVVIRLHSPKSDSLSGWARTETREEHWPENMLWTTEMVMKGKRVD